MAESNSARNGPIVSDERIRNVLKRHIDLAINVRRDTTRAMLASDSGVSIHTIDSILSRDPAKIRRVAMEDGFSLARALGDNAVQGILALIGWTGCALADEATLQPMLIAATAMQGLSVIAIAAADGRIDHTEQPSCRDAADLIIATIRPLSSAAA